MALKKEKEKVKVAKRSIDEIPKWFLKLPNDEVSLYAPGTATSTNL